MLRQSKTDLEMARAVIVTITWDPSKVIRDRDARTRSLTASIAGRRFRLLRAVCWFRRPNLRLGRSVVLRAATGRLFTALLSQLAIGNRRLRLCLCVRLWAERLCCLMTTRRIGDWLVSRYRLESRILLRNIFRDGAKARLLFQVIGTIIRP